MILLDVDGVLANFAGAVQKLFKKDEPITRWNMFEDWGMTVDEFWGTIDADGEKFWADMEPYPWIDRMLDLVHASDEFVLWSSPSRSPHCYSGKRKWVDKYVGKSTHLVLSSKKWLGARSDRMLIDDSVGNTNSFSAYGGYTFLFPQPWNTLANRVPDRFKMFDKRMRWWRDKCNERDRRQS